MIYVIADDLTGATDTGVQFSTKNYSSSVYIYQKNIKAKVLANIKVDVLVIDTETRDADFITSQKRINNILNNIKFREDDIIYKKIDSTLRGNIGLEIDLIMEKLNFDFCLFTSSFPKSSRITKNGKLIVENRELGFTDYFEGDLSPEAASYISNILTNQSRNKIELLRLEDLRKSSYNLNGFISDFDDQQKHIIVLDSVTDNDLKEIVLNSKKIKGKFLFAGSAGLANYIHLINEKEEKNKKVVFKKAEKLFIVAASRKNITNLQIEDVKNKFDVFELKIDPDQILKKPNQILEKDISIIKKAMNNFNKFIIRPNPIFSTQDKIDKLIEDYNINFRELQLEIKKYIGKLIKNIFKSYSDIDLFLTGGDTAAGICRELGVENLNIIDELLIGIPLSLAQTKKYGNLNIVTKAGGFGTKDSISKIIYKLKERKDI
ncbi:MAG: four-carbon acid sugar kinase family protein [bacterium]